MLLIIYQYAHFDRMLTYLHSYIYILGVFTEKPYSKSSQPIVFYIQINIEPSDINDVKITHGSLQSDWMCV